MTEQERDAAALGADGAVDDEAVTDAALVTEDDADESDQSDETENAANAVPDGEAVAGAGAAAAAAGGRRNRGLPKAAPAAPSVSEQAVRVDDRASAWFVIALVAIFAIVFANALLLGNGGLVSHILPTPTPVVTPVPTAKPTAAPTASPKATPTAVPSASSSAAPSASPAPTATPAATATAAPTPTPKAS